MNDENQKSDREAEFEAGDFDYKPTKEERAAERVQRLLSTVDQGWKISIIRTQPSWCRGHLETVEVYDPSETVDTDYLIRQWGGQRIHIKVHNEKGQWVGGGSISLFSYPPKVRGREIKEEDFYSSSPLQNNPAPFAQQQYTQHPTPAGANQLDLNSLLGLLQKSKKEELQFALELMKRAGTGGAQPAPAAPAAGMGAMAEQMVSMFQMFGQMKELFGSVEGGQGGGDELTPIIGDIVSKLFDGKRDLDSQQRGRGGRALMPPTGGPSSAGPPAGRAPDPGDQGVPQLHPVDSLQNDTLSGIADKLSSLSPGDASDVLIQALGNMPEEKRNAAMQEFFQNMAGGEIPDPAELLDDMENEPDTDRVEGDNDHDAAGVTNTGDPASGIRR